MREVVWTLGSSNTLESLEPLVAPPYPGVGSYTFSLSALYVTARDVFQKQRSPQIFLPRALQGPHQAFWITHKPCGRNIRKGLLHWAAQFSSLFLHSFTRDSEAERWRHQVDLQFQELPTPSHFSVALHKPFCREYPSLPFKRSTSGSQWNTAHRHLFVCRCGLQIDSPFLTAILWVSIHGMKHTHGHKDPC